MVAKASEDTDRGPNYNHSGTENHTFHLPNVFSRQTIDQGAAYHPLQRDEHVENDQDHSAEEIGDEETVSNSISSVEYSRTWSQYTSFQRTLVHLSFGVLGAAVLLPFNAIITPSEFYRSLLKGSSQENNFMSWIIILYNLSSIMFGAHATVSMSKRSIKRRITSSSIMILITLLLMTLFTFTSANSDPSVPSGFSFPIILLLTCIISAATSYLQLAVITLSNSYGARCLGFMLSGQGVVGACVSIIQLVTSIMNADAMKSGQIDHGEAKAAVSFFAINTVFMMVVIGFFWKLTKTELYIEMEENKIESNHSLEIVSESSSVPGKSILRQYMSPSTEALYDRIITVQSKSWLPCISIAYIFVITLSVFPALTSRVRQQVDKTDLGINSEQISSLVFVSWHFVAFNVSDLIGRTLPTISPTLFCPKHMMTISIFCVLRTAFIPLLAMCNLASSSAVDGNEGAIISKPFGSPTFFFLVISLGISNGFLATNTFIIGPRSPNLIDDQQRSLTAGLLSWWLTFGLSIGSFASFFISK